MGCIWSLVRNECCLWLSTSANSLLLRCVPKTDISALWLSGCMLQPLPVTAQAVCVFLFWTGAGKPPQFPVNETLEQRNNSQSWSNSRWPSISVSFPILNWNRQTALYSHLYPIFKWAELMSWLISLGKLCNSEAVSYVCHIWLVHTLCCSLLWSALQLCVIPAFSTLLHVCCMSVISD